jgi:hypothetical protein
MYQKRLLNRNIRFFKYAPPMTKLDDTTDDDRPKPPFLGAPLYMCSVYYYWWAYLRENEDYIATCEKNGEGPLADLYVDFGYIRPDNFMHWWKETGRELFAEPIVEPITAITNNHQINSDDSRVFLSIPVTGDLSRTISEIKQLLKPIFGRNEITSKAKYQVCTKPVLSSLHNQLMIYKARKENPDATNPELEMIARGNTSFKKNEDTDPYDYSTASNVSRKLSQTKRIIKNTGFGRFPDALN